MTQNLESEGAPMATTSRRELRSVTTATDRARARADFDELYAAEWSGIVALGWSLTGSWASAEELAQDAFADAYRRWDEVERMDRPGAWVRRAVINRCASHHRSRSAEQRGMERWSAQAATTSDGPGTDRTGERATDRVADPAFWAAVRSLPERQMACVSLHYLEDRSVAEIAEVLDCRPATVKVHLHRGRLALAERLGRLTSTGADDGAAAGDDLHTGAARRAAQPNDHRADQPHDQTNDRPLDDRGEEAP